MSTFAPNTKRRAALVTLREYVASQPNGARLSWVEIETATSVEMKSQYGRNLFRAACHREKRGYLPLPGGGVELSSPDNAVEIVDRYNGRVLGAVRAAADKGGYVVQRHIGEMKGDEARKLLRAASLSATLAMVGKQGIAKDQTPPPPQLTTSDTKQAAE
jgi:hypothetical protein